MKILPYVYIRHDGKPMLFIRRLTGNCRIGLFGHYYPYSNNVTDKQRELVERFRAVFDAHAVQFTGDLDTHKEPGICAPQRCGNWFLVGTDVNNVGGQKVPHNGFHLVRDGFIMHLSPLDAARS